MIEIVGDGGDEGGDAVEGAAPNTLSGDFGEPPFHQIEPRTARRREVHMEPRMSCQPSPNFWMFVSGVVVRDEVDFLPAGINVVDHA